MLQKLTIFFLSAFVVGYFWLQNESSNDLLDVDNAYVNGRVSRVSAMTDSYITALSLKSGDRVNQGELLVELDSSLLETKIESITNEIRVIVRAVSDSCMGIHESRIRLQQARTRANFIGKQRNDNQRLYDLEMISENLLSTLDNETSLAQLDMEISLARLLREQTMLSPEISQHPEVRLKLTELKSVFIEKSYRSIFAPFDGVVQAIKFYPGNFVEAGQEILTIVSSKNTELVANVLEYKLKGVSVGQRVEVKLDVDTGTLLKGRIKSITPGVSGLFSSVPVYNTDSNWIKVSQRVPVHISLDDNVEQYSLPIGASVKLAIQLKSPLALPPQTMAAKLSSGGDEKQWQTDFQYHVEHQIEPIFQHYRQQIAGYCRADSSESHFKSVGVDLVNSHQD